MLRAILNVACAGVDIILEHLHLQGECGVCKILYNPRDIFANLRYISAYLLTYGTEAWTMTALDSVKLDACAQCCLRKICVVNMSQHVTNAEIRRRTGQLPVRKLIAKQRLELFDQISRSDLASDTRRAVAATAPRDWRRS